MSKEISILRYIGEDFVKQFLGLKYFKDVEDHGNEVLEQIEAELLTKEAKSKDSEEGEK